MAEVFAGHAMGDHGFQKPVAIKRLLPELANDTVFVERLISEAKLLVGMQHGNIVSVLDLARDGDDVFLVMEFVDGPSLRQLLKARGTRLLPFGVTSYIVQSAAAGLEFAHARPGGAIIHADISPSNLLLTTSGEVRVADFGIARREGGGHGVVEGKWAYMAPEQARGEPLTPRSDVFALGVVLYELLTGEHPFGRQVTAEEREDEPMRVIPPRVVNPTIPHGLDAICMRALAHEPRERYARMQQLADAILDERFANQWREGASDLATAIKAVVPSVGGTQSPRTMVTDRPVTIVTRSLIEQTPHRRSSSRISGPIAAPAAEHTLTPVPLLTPVPELDAPPADPDVASQADTAPEGFEIPSILRAQGAPMPAFRFSQAHLPAAELASVHGGTMASVHGATPIVAPRTNRWAFLVLSAATIVGIVAAVVIQVGPSKVATAEPVVAHKTPAPRSDLATAVSPDIAVPAVAPTVPTAAAPALEQVATATVAVEPATAAASIATETTAPDKPRTQARSKPAPAARKKEPGMLRLSAYPWAYVQVDGGSSREISSTKLTLSPGRHAIRFFNDQGNVKQRSVVIESGRVKSLKVNFETDTIEERD